MAILGGLFITAAFYVTLSFATPLAVEVSPKLAIGRTNVTVRSRIWPDDANRAFRIDLVSEDGDTRVTTSDLNGSHEPMQRVDLYRGVAPGLYAVRVCLFRTDKVFCQTAEVEIHP